MMDIDVYGIHGHDCTCKLYVTARPSRVVVLAAQFTSIQLCDTSTIHFLKVERSWHCITASEPLIMAYNQVTCIHMTGNLVLARKTLLYVDVRSLASWR